MKPLISLLVAAILALSGLTVAYAAEESDAVQPPETVLGTGDESRDDTLLGSTEPTTQPAQVVEAKPSVIKGNFKSEDKNYKLYIYDNGKVAYADIIKYIGKDKLPESLTISRIDGYKIRQIREKAFSKLKSVKNVKFKGTVFSEKTRSAVMKNAFYNCKNMESFKTDSFVKMKSKCVGYVDGKPSESFKKLVFNDKTSDKTDVSSKLAYAQKAEAKTVYNVSENNTDNRKASLTDFVNGEEFSAKVEGKTVEGWKSSKPEVISISDKGKATVLTKGTTTLSVKVGKKKIKREFAVKHNPYLSVKGEKTDEVDVGVRKTVKVEIKGKADSVDNVYTASDYAGFECSESDETLSVKGIQKGDTKLKVNVNGKDLKLKVKVNKTTITDEKMARIAAKIGNQAQYRYADSKVMCSAYSYAYAYWQVTGSKITPWALWCPGGCMWTGGTYTHYPTRAAMLKAIRKSIDRSEACVGLLSIGNSSQHYVTFYDYEGDGKDLSDFKILDPWAGNLTTGWAYGYSYGYHVVTVDN